MAKHSICSYMARFTAQQASEAFTLNRCLLRKKTIQLQGYRLKTFISSFGSPLVLNEVQHLSLGILLQ